MAALVDKAVLIGSMLASIGLAMVGFAAYDRVRGKRDEQDGEADGGVSESHATREFRLSPQLNAALWGVPALPRQSPEASAPRKQSARPYRAEPPSS